MHFYFKTISLLEGMHGQEVSHEMCFSCHWNVSFCTGSGQNDLCSENLYLQWQRLLLRRSRPEEFVVGFQTLDAALAALGVGVAVRGTRGNLGYLGKGRRRKTWNRHKSRRCPELYPTGQLASFPLNTEVCPPGFKAPWNRNSK